MFAGYCICNDVSEREFPASSVPGQWVKGKSAPTFGPLGGPWLVTPDEIENVQALEHVASTSAAHADADRPDRTTMIFGVKMLVSYISQFIVSLEPGDVITTGTPPGVGQGKKPPRFLETRRHHVARRRGARSAGATGRGVEG